MISLEDDFTVEYMEVESHQEGNPFRVYEVECDYDLARSLYRALLAYRRIRWVKVFVHRGDSKEQVDPGYLERWFKKGRYKENRKPRTIVRPGERKKIKAATAAAIAAKKDSELHETPMLNAIRTGMYIYYVTPSEDDFTPPFYRARISSIEIFPRKNRACVKLRRPVYGNISIEGTIDEVQESLSKWRIGMAPKDV